MRQKLFSILLIFIFFVCITNCNIIFSGTLNGINLLLFKVVPTLFPFLLLTGFMKKYNATKYISNIFSPILCPLLGISKNACFIIFTGMMCGYPISAKMCSEMVEANELSVSEANYLQTFTNNASPSFVFSYIGALLLNNSKSAFSIFIIYYIPILLTAITLNPFFRIHSKTEQTSFMPNSTNISSKNNCSVILNSIITLVNIGTYIIIFSNICSLINELSHYKYKAIFLGMLEITTGTKAIIDSGLNCFYKYLFLYLSLSFGGISTFFQVKSVILSKNIRMPYYIIGKAIALFFTFLIYSCFMT